MFDLSGRVAIITGASQGFGRAIADAYLRAGASVVICARDRDLLSVTAAELHELCKRDQEITAVPCNVANPDEVRRLAETALKQHDKVHVLVNNAGIYGPMGLLEEVPWDEWREAVDINLNGTALLMRELLPHFRANRFGKIINLSGGGATAPLPRFSAYGASKAAVVRLTETIAKETEGSGIEINAVAPGALNTRLLDEVLDAGPDRVGSEFYNRALKQKEEGGASLEKAAQLCVFLGSDSSDGITGKILSAVWDAWIELPAHIDDLKASDVYTLRRIVPADRSFSWGQN